MKKTLHIVTTIIMLSCACTHTAASECSSSSALIKADLQPKSYDFIGLSVNPRGNHVMLTQESHKDLLSVILVYSEDSELKKTDTLTEIAQKFSTGTQGTFLSTFKKTVDQYLAHKLTRKSESYDPIMRTENLIALYMQLSRGAEPLKQWYEIETSLSAYHEGATTVHLDMIRYIPCISRLGDISPFAPTSCIAQELQAQEPNRPFHLVIQTEEWKFPHDRTKKWKCISGGYLTIHPSSDKHCLILTTVEGSTEYKEGPVEGSTEYKEGPSAYALTSKQFYEEEKAQLPRLSRRKSL